MAGDSLLFGSLFDACPATWDVVPFGDAVDYQEGPGILAKDFHLAGVPLIRLKCVQRPTVSLNGCNFLDPEKVAKKWNHFRLMHGDLLISTSATIGMVSAIGPEAVGAVAYTGLIRLRPRNGNVWAGFIKQFAKSSFFVQQAEGMATGSVIRHFGPWHLKQMAFPLPPLPEQKAIAHVLGTLDDLIELNRETNEILEEMARALFKSWFVDFDPVRAKLEGRPPAGMAAATAALFPDHFQDSELGQIPKGWKVRPLSSLSSYLSRGIGPSYVEEGGVCVLNQKCVRDHRVDLTKARRHCAATKKVDGRLLERFDVLVNSTGTGTLGRVAQIFHLDEDTIVDSHVTVVRAASDVDHCFLGGAITNRETDIEELAEGSTGQTELSRTRLGALSIVTPSAEIQRAFGRLVGPTFHLISANDLESRDLATLRDTLLPKLLSGEVTAPVAEELVAATSARS